MFLDCYTNIYFIPCSGTTGLTNTTVLALDLRGARMFGYMNCYGPITEYDSSFNSLKVLLQYQESHIIVIN